MTPSETLVPVELLLLLLPPVFILCNVIWKPGARAEKGASAGRRQLPGLMLIPTALCLNTQTPTSTQPSVGIFLATGYDQEAAVVMHLIWCLTCCQTGAQTSLKSQRPVLSYAVCLTPKQTICFLYEYALVIKAHGLLTCTCMWFMFPLHLGS